MSQTGSSGVEGRVEAGADPGSSSLSALAIVVESLAASLAAMSEANREKG